MRFLFSIAVVLVAAATLLCILHVCPFPMDNDGRSYGLLEKGK